MALQYSARPGFPAGGTLGTQALDLFLKVYTGEVLKTFKETNVMRGLTRRRTLMSGRSAQFLGVGKMTAGYHTIGDNILIDSGYLQQPLQGEKLIHIDKELLSAVVIPNIEEAMSQYDYRGPMSEGQGRVLGLEYDKALFKVGIKGSRSATGIPINSATLGFPNNPATGGSWSGTRGLVSASLNGAVAGGAASSTIGAGALALAVVAAQTFDEREVPRSDRYFAVNPCVYWSLVLNKELLNHEQGGASNGVFYDGTIWRCAGFQLVMTNNLPSTNDTSEAHKMIDDGAGANPALANDYAADYTLTKGLFWHKDALATVELLGLKMEQEYKVELRGTLMVASYAVGHGFLRSDSLIEMQSAA